MLMPQHLFVPCLVIRSEPFLRNTKNSDLRVLFRYIFVVVRDFC